MKCQKYKMTLDKMMKGKYKGDLFNYEKKAKRFNYRYLKSGYYENQVWGALHKAWLGYTIACNKWNEYNKMIYYARVIRKLQMQLGLELSEFDCLD
jgi:hypothetical protein